MAADRSKTEIAAWIAAAAVLLFLTWKLMAPGGSGAAGGAPVSVSSPDRAADAPRRTLYVHVAGRVRNPGLYSLRAGARIATAIERAGGAAPGADLSAVNLAMKVQDGQQVLVPRRGAAASGAAGSGAGGAGGSAAGGRRISLATATVEQLDQLDGIGPTLARRIIDYREKHGGFRSVEELKQVDGIGEKRFAALEDSVGP